MITVTIGDGDMESTGVVDVDTHPLVARSKTNVVPGVWVAQEVCTAPGVLRSTGASVINVPLTSTMRTGPTFCGVL